MKNRWVNSNKAKKKLRLRWNYHRSTLPVNSYTINPSMRTDRGEGALGTRFHVAVSLQIADCVD